MPLSLRSGRRRNPKEGKPEDRPDRIVRFVPRGEGLPTGFRSRLTRASQPAPPQSSTSHKNRPDRPRFSRLRSVVSAPGARSSRIRRELACRSINPGRARSPLSPPVGRPGAADGDGHRVVRRRRAGRSGPHHRQGPPPAGTGGRHPVRRFARRPGGDAVCTRKLRDPRLEGHDARRDGRVADRRRGAQ